MPQATTFDKRIFISSEKKGKKEFLTSDCLVTEKNIKIKGIQKRKCKDFKAATHQTLQPASIESF